MNERKGIRYEPGAFYRKYGTGFRVNVVHPDQRPYQGEVLDEFVELLEKYADSELRRDHYSSDTRILTTYDPPVAMAHASTRTDVRVVQYSFRDQTDALQFKLRFG